MFMQPRFKVIYMTAEMWAVPDFLEYEILSVPEKLKTFYEDRFPCPKYDDVPSISIHASSFELLPLTVSLLRGIRKKKLIP